MSFDKALTVQYLIERPRDWITDVTLRSMYIPFVCFGNTVSE